MRVCDAITNFEAMDEVFHREKRLQHPELSQIRKEFRRQTINVDDVLKAIEEIEFPEFAEPTRASLDGLRKKKANQRK